MKFRKDVNGLRAFAVIAVVLFHFNASWMPGGFAGVDVFFVISGFLMTGIIFKGLENNNFSVLNFYVARANRIIPALAALCLALLVFGWFYLTPLEYRALGKHAASSVGFLSNIIYFTEAGYFDAASHEKWLLHTWSLSVEWQFYIIYPVVLLALKRIFSLKTLKSLIIVATVIGFMFSVYATYKWPSASYYLLPMRAWEMMLGGVAFLYPLKLQENNKKLVEILGLVLIVTSYIFITGDDPWPGYLALLPVLGTFLVIQAQRNESIITGNIVFQKLGAWSYSIYLWHWPFVVAIYTFSLPDQYIYIGMALSVLLGYLSYKYIERIKFPRSFPTISGYLKCKPILIAATLGAVSTLIFMQNGNNSNSELVNSYLVRIKPNSNLEPCINHFAKNDALDKGLDCRVGITDAKPIGLIWGDSYAGRLEPFIYNLIYPKKSFISRTISSCQPSISQDISLGKSYPEACKNLRLDTIRQIKQDKFKVIILAGRWDLMFRNDGEPSIEYFLQAVDIAAKHSDLVYVFAQPILYEKNFTNIILRNKITGLTIPNERNDLLPRKLNTRLQKELTTRNYTNVYFIDRDIIYGGKNHSDFTVDGLPFTSDDGHLSYRGAISASNSFKESKLYQPLELLIEKE